MSCRMDRSLSGSCEHLFSRVLTNSSVQTQTPLPQLLNHTTTRIMHQLKQHQISANRQQTSSVEAKMMGPEKEATRRRIYPTNRYQLVISVLSLLYLSLQLHLANAQCPWTRDSVELHSDCICDFNPSTTTNLESQQPVNRMSVQCSPVNFEQLIRALKQTASIELPQQLIKLPVAKLLAPDENLQSVAEQLASQVKLDLLHISNSSMGQLRDNTFIVAMSSTGNSSGNSADSGSPTDHRHLVVAIQSLHLSRCNIERIQPQAFNGLEWSLTSLSLSDNELEFVPVNAISRLVHLKVLDLSNNRLIQIPANSFATLNKLNTLRLADNRLSQKVDLMAFAGLEASLSDLNLKNAQLATFPLAIKTLRNLAFLNLAQNQISQVPPRSFEHMNSLTAINLERNRISRIENDTFLGVEGSLSSLSLLGNLLESFPVSQLSKLTVIRRLDMGFNGIESLPSNAFAANRQLILIALDGNPLDTLPEAAFKPLEGVLRGLSIGGKALDCDCRLSWMLRWQQEFNMQISSRERQPQFCAKPHYLRSLVSFSALKPEHLTCTSTVSAASYAPILFTTNQRVQNGSNSWANNENQPVYFTLPMMFNQETPATTITTTTSSLAKTPFELVTLATPSQSTSTSGRPADSSTSSSIDLGSVIITTTTTSSTPVGSQDNATESMDLTEAGTNDEPTLQSEEDDFTTATSVHLASESPISSPQTTRFSSGSTAHLIHYGERFSPGINHNGLSSLPDDELFVTDSSKKLNRNGFLPAQKPPVSKQQSHLLDEILRHSSVANMTKNQRTAAQSLINSLDLIRRNKTSTSGQSSAVGNEPGTRLAKPIQSVFGSRAANEHKRGGNTSGRGSSSSSTVGQQQSGGSPSSSSAQKGARFVDEPPSSSTQLPRTTAHQKQVASSTSTTQAPTSSSSRRPSAPPSFEMRLVDRDIERYAIAASSISSRVATESSSASGSTSSSSVSPQPAPAPPTSNPMPVAFDSTKIETTTSSPPTVTAAARQASANNTRMSVSSMYRMATSAPASKTTAGPSTPGPAQLGISLEAAAEDASQKITRTAPPTSSTTTPQPPPRQPPTVSSRALPEVRRIIQPETLPPTTQQAPARNWASKTATPSIAPTGRTSSTMASVSQPAATTTPRPPLIEPAVVTTTRMAATVRIVDATAPILRLIAINQTDLSRTTVPLPEASEPIRTRSPPPPLVEAPRSVGVATLSRQPHSVVVATTAATTKPLLFGHEQQHEARMTLSGKQQPTSVAVEQPVVGAATAHGVGSVEQVTPSATTVQVGGSEQPPGRTSVRVGDLSIQLQQQPHSARQPKDDSSTGGGQQVAANQRTFFGKLVRLTDFDQVALVLASLLCVFILVLALTVIGVCCSNTCCSAEGRKSGATGARLASFSSSSDNSREQQQRQHSNGNLSAFSWLCCWLRPGKRVTPMRSLILSDDDNSSGSGGSSNGHKSTGKSMLLAGSGNSPLSANSLSCGQDLLVESVRKASMRVSRAKQPSAKEKHRITTGSAGIRNQPGGGKRLLRSYDSLEPADSGGQPGPIDHEASIQRHRLAHALEQEYFVGVSRGVGRRQSMVVLNRRPQEGEESDEWVRDDALSSCDSDKSCSPGANRNNRYNISEAHRAYLSSKSAQKQIQASMYVTTSGGSPKNGLLKTIDRSSSHNHHQHLANGDYLERLSRISSDKSTTDDSRAPLSSSRPRAEYRPARNPQSGLCTMRPPTSKSFGGGGGGGSSGLLHRSRSIGRLPPADMTGYPTGVDRSSLGCEFLNSDLVPMSAEEQWPEPYVEPEDPEQQASECGTKLGDQFASSYRADNAFPPTSGSHTLARNPSDNFNSRRTHNRRPTAGSAHRLAHDDAYLANWHTMSRTARPTYTAAEASERPAEQRSANYHLQPANSDAHSTLIRYRSIPNSLNGNQQAQQQQQQQQQHQQQMQQNQQNHQLLSAQVSGATNWLRWTPTSFMSQGTLGPQNDSSQQPGNSTVGRGWHRDNHVEAVYIAANQQR